MDFKRLVLATILISLGSAEEPFRCTKAGLYPADKSTQFISCTSAGVDGKSFKEAILTCPPNTIFKGKKCEPAPIEKLIRPLVGPSESVVNEDAQDEMTIPCKTHGLICSSCKDQSICIGQEQLNGGDTVYNQIKMHTCLDSEVCVPGRGCMPKERNFCPYRKFECGDVGVFPDAYDCTTYYKCDLKPDKTFEKTSFKCKQGSFEAGSASCGYPLNRTSCITSPVPMCQAVFQMGPVPDNLNIYYICVPDDATNTLAPVFYKCLANTSFDISTLTCRK